MLAPVVVVGGLQLQRASLVFLSYHVGLCLLVPWLLSWRRGLCWRGHLAALALAPRGVTVGLVGALVLAALPPALATLMPSLLPDAAQLGRVLDRWGLDADRLGPVLLFLALVNGPAEELFWRGWLPTRLGTGVRPTIALSLLFASYHAVTVVALAPGMSAAVVMLAGVAAATGIWAWMRWRWGSVWPSLLTHLGASVGYALVAGDIMTGWGGGRLPS